MTWRMEDPGADHILAWHGTVDPVAPGFRFDAVRVRRAGLHLGTLAQARMRTGRGSLIQVRLRLPQPYRALPRVCDQAGAWTRLVARRRARGHQVLVYLNRYEGLGEASVLRLAGRAGDPDRLGDAAFRELAPEARDSFLVLDPDLVSIAGVFPPGAACPDGDRHPTS